MESLKEIKEEFSQYESTIQDLISTLIQLRFEHQSREKEDFIENLYLNGTIRILVSIIQFIDSKLFKSLLTNPHSSVSETYFEMLSISQNSDKGYKSLEREESQFIGRFLMKKIIKINLVALVLCKENPKVQGLIRQKANLFILLEIIFPKEIQNLFCFQNSDDVRVFLDSYEEIHNRLMNSRGISLQKYITLMSSIIKKVNLFIKIVSKQREQGFLSRFRTFLDNKLI